MPNKLSRYADGVMEAAWLAAVVLLPVYFNLYSSRIFEPDKISVLRSLALIILVAWLVKAISGEVRFQPAEAGSHRLNWRDLLATPMVLPALGFLAITLLATLFSLNPRISFWGSYQRLQGAYTSFAYLVLFAALLVNLRSPEKLQRLITAIITSSLPVALYGILQRYQLDPIPWGGDVTIRVAANLGNSIFVAAYLIMVIPLVAGRMLVAFRAILLDDSPHVPAMLKATLYVFMLVLQIYTLYLSGSRGPALGWLAGSFLMVMVLAIYTRRRWLAGSLAALTVLGLVFLALFNTQAGVFERLRSQPAIGRFGKLLDQQSNTALVRKYIWQGAARLVAPHAPLMYPDGSPDTWNSLRLLVGYGPESMIVAYTPFYPPELAHVERRNAVPDRSHNEVWDTLVTTGVLGLAIYLAMILSFFYWGFRWLGLIPDQAWLRRYWLLLGVSGITGSLVFFLWQGIAYLGVGLPLGLVLGWVLYVILLALFGVVETPRSQRDFTRAMLLLSLLAAVLAHFVETNFGIAIGVTRAYFWVYAAVLVVAGLRWLTEMPEAEDLKTSHRTTENLSTGVAPTSKKRNPPSAGPAPEWKPSLAWLQPAVYTGLILALILAAFGYIYLSNPGGEQVGLSAVWASLTKLQASAPGASWAVVGLIFITMFAAMSIIGAEADTQAGTIVWWRVGLAGLALAALPVMGFWVWHGSRLVAIARVRASTIAGLLSQVERFESLPANFLAFAYGMVLLFPLLGMIGKHTGPRTSPVKLFLSAILFGAALWLGMTSNLRPIQADVAFKLAGQFNQPESGAVAAQILQKATDLAPQEDYYHLFLGQAYLTQASTLETGPQQDALILQARDSLLSAQAINPFNPDHTANLARLYNLWALMLDDPGGQLEKAQQADNYFAVALRLSPNHARLWNEWSVLYRDLFQDEQRSQELLEHSLSLDPQYDWTHALLGDQFLRWATTPEQPLSAQQTEQLLRKAAAEYETALETVDEDATQTVGRYKLTLAEIYRQLNQYDAAIRLVSDPVLLEILDAWRIAEQLGRLYQQKGDQLGAQAYARQALELAPPEQQASLEAWLAELGGRP